MNYAHLLAEGVGSWLQYEHSCGHSGLFSEKYLAQPVGHILSARSGNRAHAEYTHPILAPQTSGSGRRPAIDFVVCEQYPSISIAVETKWVGSTKPSVESIAWDLIRLELLAHHENAQCYFLLGGKRRDLENFFGLSAFSTATSDRQRKPLLRHDAPGQHIITLALVDKARAPVLDDVFKKYPKLLFPAQIVSHRSKPFPVEQTKDSYQVYVWLVRPSQPRTTISGERMLQYYPKKRI